MQIVVADAAYASRENLQAIQARQWFFVLAFPRTWKFTDGPSLRELVAHLPHAHYRKVRLPLVGTRAQYRVFWTFAKRTTLRELGGRHCGAQQTKVYPELVVRGEKGEIESVQYQELIPLMLNEMQHRKGNTQYTQSSERRIASAAGTARRRKNGGEPLNKSGVWS